MSETNSEFRVMTSGAFTAAYLALIPQIERVSKRKVVTVTTSIGSGDISIENRLKRGEAADLVVVAEPFFRQFQAAGLVDDEGHRIVARSIVEIGRAHV